MEERGNNHIKVRKVFEQQNWLLLFCHNNNEPIFCKGMSDAQNALACLNVVNNLPYRTKGEAVLIDHVPKDAKRILDLGIGDGD